MTHEDERPFHERVVEWLRAEYGEDAVETDKYLKETGRYADAWVEAPLGPLAIEVENDFEAVLKGVGQTLLYAAHDEHGAEAYVVVPPGHVDQPEADLLRRRGVKVREVDV